MRRCQVGTCFDAQVWKYLSIDRFGQGQRFVGGLPEAWRRAVNRNAAASAASRRELAEVFNRVGVDSQCSSHKIEEICAELIVLV